MILRLREDSQTFPRVGDHVDLEVHLPVNVESVGAKDLTTRGQIVEVGDVRDGARQFTLSFRKAQFKDRNGAGGRRKRKSTAGGWEN